MLAAYVEWHMIMTKHVPKSIRYSLGVRIDSLFAELVAVISGAQFAAKNERATRLSNAITLNDTLKFMLYALLELKGIDEKKFLFLSERMDEIGRMLYGWKQKSGEHPDQFTKR